MRPKVCQIFAYGTGGATRPHSARKAGAVCHFGAPICCIGLLGLIFEVSSLFSNVISTLGLPALPSNSHTHTFNVLMPVSLHRLMMQTQKGPNPSSASAPIPRIKCEYNSENSQNFRTRLAYSQGSKELGGTKTPACAKCGRSHSRVCHDGSTSCFKCGRNSHFTRECLKSRQSNGNGGNKAQSFSVAPPDRVASR
ncbi:hypothetical protein MTR67_012782 [Solanum verrucosum]|uniref:CCHC-type domain-containing protein n=1 Tax=Solanum verrucosum TaxID=315347 RepID=A0AAF0QAG2_SOLVR|nr:hypothetical protein MTR67_012782 [Solanum verrucosum]